MNLRPVALAVSLGAALVVVAGSCTSNEGKETMSIASVGAVREIRLVSESGPSYGSDLPKHRIELQVNCRDNTARLEKLRSSSDEPEEPIGLFEAKVTADECSRLVALLEEVKFATLRELQGVTPGHAVISVSVDGEDDSLTRRFSPIDGELMAEARPLVDGLFEFAAGIEEQPVAAIQISVVEQGGGADNRRFALVVKNIGSAPAMISEPRALPQTEAARAGIRVAAVPPEEPDVTSPPPEWEFIPIQQPDKPESLPQQVVLKPQESRLYQVEDLPSLEAGTEYLVQGLIIDYSNRDAEAEAYQVRGAVFSDIVDLAM